MVQLFYRSSRGVLKVEIKKKIVIIDIETTGFSPFADEITEVGLIALDGATLDVVGMFDALIKIEGKIPKKVVELTGITNELTDKYGHSKEYVGDIVREMTEGAILVAHNAPFDFSFLAQHFDIDPKFFYDTLSLSRFAYPEEKKHNLKDVCIRLGVNLVGHHRAINDCMATLDVMKHFFREHEGWRHINRLHKGGRGLQYKPTHTKEVVG